MAASHSRATLTLAMASLSVVSALPQSPRHNKPAASFPDGHNTPLGRQVHQLLADPAVSRAHLGLAVTTLSGTPIYGFNEGKLFRPASTAKLFTTAAALDILGPGFRFHTRAYGDLDTTSGLVRG